MNKTQHIPTPWDAKEAGTQAIVWTDDGRSVAVCYGHYGDAMADAAFIVRAVNAHEALVEALERLTAAADKCIPSDDCSNWSLNDADEAIRQGLAALKLAKGE